MQKIPMAYPEGQPGASWSAWVWGYLTPLNDREIRGTGALIAHPATDGDGIGLGHCSFVHISVHQRRYAVGLEHDAAVSNSAK